MEVIESMFKSVIIDSFDEKNKIKSISEFDIYVLVEKSAYNMIEKLSLNSETEFVKQELLKFIRLIKRYKPGYVIKDIINLFELGAIEYEFNFTEKTDKLEPIINFSASEIFEKWFRVYGMKKHRHLRYDENKVLLTNRGECMGLALKDMNKNPIQEYDSNDPKYTSLLALKEKYGVEYMKKYFPNIIALLRGDIKIGCPVEDIPITNHPDPMLEDL